MWSQWTAYKKMLAKRKKNIKFNSRQFKDKRWN
jgi:hypothetical protein